MSSNHSSPAVERHCDVCVIGASAAGLAAALESGRRRRSVIVIDAGESADGREEVRGHGGEIIPGRVNRVTRGEDGDFRVDLAGGHRVIARRVLSAADGYSLDREDRDREDRDREDDGVAARPAGNESDWDHRYGGDQIWSGNPNGTLVSEVSGLAPGRALDVGAGEGGDAIWLAGQGWNVTANDISRRALDRISAEAGRRGLRVECHHADANTPGAFGARGAFDLVCAQYASIPRTPDDRAVRNVLNAVAPGGTLLIVSHDLEPLRAMIEQRAAEPAKSPDHGPAFDPDAYVRVDDFAAALAAEPGWDIEVHEKRERPAGAASASHHVHDIVLRARRHAR